MQALSSTVEKLGTFSDGTLGCVYLCDRLTLPKTAMDRKCDPTKNLLISDGLKRLKLPGFVFVWKLLFLSTHCKFRVKTLALVGNAVHFLSMSTWWLIFDAPTGKHIWSFGFDQMLMFVDAGNTIRLASGFKRLNFTDGRRRFSHACAFVMKPTGRQLHIILLPFLSMP